jgi:NhaA family Na+:H+ antiporter
MQRPERHVSPREDSPGQGGFARFFKSEAAGSILLLGATVFALAWANSPGAGLYDSMLHARLGVSWSGSIRALSLHHWVNDGLMAIFFFVVGLEIKRELAVGQLSSFRSAILPVGAALGGVMLPALIYAGLNAGGMGSHGWGIPMATDIAFALGVLALLGPRVPVGLKVFLTAVAIADDLGAVVVISVFYTDQIHTSPLLVAGGLLGILFLLARLGFHRVAVFLPLALGVWVATLLSGVHATVAGVLLAMLVPVRARIEPTRFLGTVRHKLAELESVPLSSTSMVSDRAQLASIEDLHDAAGKFLPAGIALEHLLHPWTAFVILPLFALFNAGVHLSSGALDRLQSPVSLGIVVGLFAGKQIGITLASWIAVRALGAELPAGVTLHQVWGASVLGGIGFTMSIFISGLAFGDEGLVASAKLGILAASVLAGACGYAALRWILRTG